MDEEPLASAVETPPAETLPPRRARWKLWVGLIALAVAGVWGWIFWTGWTHIGPLEPSGGLYFFGRHELAVPLFRQGDPRWRGDLLGPTPGTLGAEGCAITSVAMVLSFYGVDTDPQRLNAFLNANEGYTPQGWVYWEKAAEMAPYRVKHVYEAEGSYQLIDDNLHRNNPVIVKLRLPSGTTHFVVIAGKQGLDYLTRDPGAGSAKGLYPLKELHSRILGLRFYEKLKEPG